MYETPEEMNPLIVPALQRVPEQFYVPQFGTAETVEREILHRANADMNLPEWNWCGMCCTQMILRALGRSTPGLKQMYERATHEYGVYRTENGQVVGAYHKELAKYIEEEFSLSARTARGLTLPKLVELIRGGTFIIASVSPEIRELKPGKEPPTKNGHLVLVYGLCSSYEDADGHGVRALILHNSAGFQNQRTQCHARLRTQRFMDCFSGNAILVHP